MAHTIANPTLKRTILSLENDDAYSCMLSAKDIHVNKKQKYDVVPDVGLLSPPVTPEHSNKHSEISKDSLKSVTKKLKLLVEPETRSGVSPYTKAKNLFLRSSDPCSSRSNFILTGREKEASLVKSFIAEAVKNSNSASLYVSGPPGTGKSAQINATINHLIEHSTVVDQKNSIYYIHQLEGNLIEQKIRIIRLNCMSLSNPTDLFKEIYHQITGRKYNISIGSSQLFDLFNNSNGITTILLLDEMDNIVKKSQQSLFELFTHASNLLDENSNNNSIPQQPKLGNGNGNGNQNGGPINNNLGNSNLVLIGIANSLNLTDRFLPRLRANCISPKLVQFLPYTAEQIKSVIANKLMTLKNDPTSSTIPPLVHPAAIQFCAKKSASTTGDLRKAFDVMFKSIDLFEQSLLKSHSLDKLNDMQLEGVDTLPKVMISHVVKVCSSSFNANFDLKLKPLNLQQKVILAFLFKFEEKLQIDYSKKSKIGKSVNCLNVFFEYYMEKCKLINHFTPLKRSEFLEIITYLDINGLLVISMVGVSSSTKSLISNSVASLNFDNYKVATNIPQSEFYKNVNENILLKRIIYGHC